MSDLTLRDLVGALTLKQVAAILSLVSVVIAGTFTLGLSIERSAHANQIQDLKSQLLRLENEKMSTHDSLVHLQAKEQFLEITSLIQFNASLYGIDIWDKRRWDSSYHRYMLSAVGYEDLVKEYRDHVRRITTEFVSDEPFAIAKHGRERAGPSLLQFSRDRTTWVLIPNLSSPP